MRGYYHHRGYRGGPYYGGRRPRKDGDDCTTSCIVYFILGIIAMPLLGLYLILKKDADDSAKTLGWVLLIVGIIIYGIIGAHAGG